MSFVPPPPPSLNGGLYTGEPFQKGAAWANVPAAPDAGNYNFNVLPASVPSMPVAAMYHLPGGGYRPGNNTPMLPDSFSGSRVPTINALCVPDAEGTRTRPDENGGFRQYADLD
jgi:hypothetical protein